MRVFILKLVGLLMFTAVAFAMLGAYKSTTSVQRGNPGLGMDTIEQNDRLEARAKANAVPRPLPAASQDGQLSVDAYKNVQVLGHISSGEMTRLMTAISIWVAPKQGCAYCHAPQRDASGNVVLDADGNPQADQNNLHSDELYTKRVARRMLQMTMHINSDWKSHVKDTGVTCFSCHRGNPVPTYIWYDQTENDADFRMLGNKAGQNTPSPVVGLTALPNDPFRPFLVDDDGIRIQSTAALPIDNRSSIKQTEWTYGLMMHISNALGVNCTYCHNSRSMGIWTASPPARATAWYGIRMVRDLNKTYLEGLLSTFPAERLGPVGDAPKLNCATCHQGAFKPLLGVSILKDYMVLAEAKPQPAKTPVPPPAPPVPVDPNAPAGTAAPAGTTAPAGTVVPAPVGTTVPAGTIAPAGTAVPAAPLVPATKLAPTGTTAPAVVPTAPGPAAVPAAPPAAAPAGTAAPTPQR